MKYICLSIPREYWNLEQTEYELLKIREQFDVFNVLSYHNTNIEAKDFSKFLLQNSVIKMTDLREYYLEKFCCNHLYFTDIKLFLKCSKKVNATAYIIGKVPPDSIVQKEIEFYEKNKLNIIRIEF
jgi:hypothetical protein